MSTRRADAASIALIAFAMLRIASTWTVFSATMDEPMHVSAGLQIYTQHEYTMQRENPPLPRLVLAFAPWIGGMEFDPSRDVAAQLRAVFYSNGHYKTNLVLARAGNLVFFVVASLAVWAWARRELGPGGGLIATLLFTMQPMMVGHAGLATHDLAATAGVALSLLAFTRRHAIAFGAAFGFAVLCKFSCIGYVPAACLAITIVRGEWRSVWRMIAAAAIVTPLVIWIGYGFTVTPFIDGIRKLAAVDRAGHVSYFFGELRTTGWWSYFPFAVVVKTTIASLVLAGMGLLGPIGRIGRGAAAGAVGILLVAMPSQLDLGVRYVLPLYAPLSVAAAAAALAMMQSARVFLRVAAIALLAWHAGASLLAHPDTFPYFNEAAGREPWRYLIDSNLDWGQDALRLRRVVRERKIDRIGLAVQGHHDWDALGFPPHYDLHRDHPSRGWVAVSEHIWGLAHGAPWLEGRPCERIGTSIRLYQIP